MFGVKKEKTIKANDNFSNKNYIFYDDNKFSHQLEICAILSNAKDKQVAQSPLQIIVLISQSSPIEFLNVKIAEGFEKYPQFKDLAGLKATNLHKISGKGEKIILPTEGIINDIIKENGDIIYFEMEAKEYWIKCVFSLNCLEKTQMIQVDYNLNKMIPFKKLKLLLLKAGMNYFKEILKETNPKDRFTLMIKNVRFSFDNSKDEVNFNSETLDKFIIGELFSFESQLLCSISFDVFEEIILKHLQKEMIEVKIRQLKWTHFKELTFEQLLTEKAFAAEKKTIQSLAKDVIDKELENIKEANTEGNYYFYIEDVFNSINSLDINNDSNMEDIRISRIPEEREQIVFAPPSDHQAKEHYYLLSPKLKEVQNASQSMSIEDTLVHVEPKRKNISFKTFNENMGYPKQEGDGFFPRANSNHDITECMQNDLTGSFKDHSLVPNNTNFFQKMKTFASLNLSNELVDVFGLKLLTDLIRKDYYKVKLMKKDIETMQMPEFREYAKITSFDRPIGKGQRKEPVVKISNVKILIFVMMALVYYVGAVVCIYYDCF